MSVQEVFSVALPAGTKVADYRIEKVLGEGGFGLTYLAFDEQLHKHFALKEYLPADFSIRVADHQVQPRTTASQNDFDWGLEAFINEARTLAKFHNHHIVPVHRFLTANGTAYIVMEYVQGRTLTDTVKELGALSEAEVRAILLPVMDGLQDVHDAGILHRDIKPDNILIRDNGTPVLIDFGAARQAIVNKSRSITTILTPGYAPLEQYATRGNVGSWSDIYSLAAVAYYCLTQQIPLESSERILEDKLKPLVSLTGLSVSVGFLQALDRALAIRPELRPATLADFVELLERETMVVTQSSDGGSDPVPGSLEAILVQWQMDEPSGVVANERVVPLNYSCEVTESAPVSEQSTQQISELQADETLSSLSRLGSNLLYLLLLIVVIPILVLGISVFIESH